MSQVIVQLGNKLQRFCTFDALYNGYLSIHETVGFSAGNKPLDYGMHNML